MGITNDPNYLTPGGGDMIESLGRHKRSSIVAMADLDERVMKLEQIHPNNEHVKKESPCTHGIDDDGWLAGYKEEGDKFCRDCGKQL